MPRGQLRFKQGDDGCGNGNVSSSSSGGKGIKRRRDGGSQDKNVIKKIKKHKKDRKDKKKKKKKKKKKGEEKGHKSRREHSLSNSESSDTGCSGGSSDEEPLVGRTKTPNNKPQRLVGSGRICSDLDVVTGIASRFKAELGPGDVIVLCPHPESDKEEARLVTAVFSDETLTLHKAFSSDVREPGVAFKYLKKLKDESTNEEENARKQEEKSEEMKQAFGTYYSSKRGEFTYRERVGGASGGYRIVVKQLDNELSREEQLDMRQKKKGDRYC